MPQLATLEYDHNLFDPRKPFEGDEKVPVEFYMGTILNDAKTLEAGRPIHDDVECIKIFNSKDNIIDRPIRDTDKMRWPRKFAAWKNGNQDAGVSGTRLEHWPAITRAQAEEYKYFKIFTVEQLAEMPDSVGSQIMGFQKFKALAKASVEVAKGEAPFVKMQADLAERDAMIAGQANMIEKLTKRLEKLEAKSAKE